MSAGFDKIIYWNQNYAAGGIEDRRAIGDVRLCESAEFLKPFESQLYTISQGTFDEENLHQIVGLKRKIKHGSYEQWAKLMLQWLREPM